VASNPFLLPLPPKPIAMIRLAILASGSGTNAENLIRYFTGHALISVAVVFTNKAEAKVLQKAARHHVPAFFRDRDFWTSPADFLLEMNALQIDVIVLAGFLLKVDPEIIAAYPNKILNIHPALLPKYGGKGMYGDRVHQAVLANGDRESGITIHLVNEHYDEGRILFQASCPVHPEDSAETLAKRIHELEYRHFPKVIEQFIFPGHH
jgi:phosphoribosylglycinamide formyltransferase 1